VKNSFEGVEDIRSFTNVRAIEAYRATRLNGANLRAQWLAEQSALTHPFAVVEVGAGSSCLLYSFAESGILSHGIGIEPTHSRYEFAEHWRRAIGYENVENLCATFQEVPVRRAAVDMVLILDNTLSYMCSGNEGNLQITVTLAFQWLRVRGMLVIEVADYARKPNWERHVETQSDSRFSASSHRIELLSNDEVLSESMVFPRIGDPIKRRDGARCIRKEHLEGLLLEIGFEDIRITTEAIPWVNQEGYPHYILTAVRP